MIYGRTRYEYRGKFAETRFERECLRDIGLLPREAPCGRFASRLKTSSF
jgi:hypothetical protein